MSLTSYQHTIEKVEKDRRHHRLTTNPQAREGPSYSLATAKSWPRHQKNICTCEENFLNTGTYCEDNNEQEYHIRIKNARIKIF